MCSFARSPARPPDIRRSCRFWRADFEPGGRSSTCASFALPHRVVTACRSSQSAYHPDFNKESRIGAWTPSPPPQRSSCEGFVRIEEAFWRVEGNNLRSTSPRASAENFVFAECFEGGGSQR